MEENIAAYRFSAAEEQLKTELATLKRKRKPVSHIEAQIEQLQHLQSLLDATCHVVFIDSTVVEKNDFLSSITLSTESGRLTTYARTFHKPDTLGCTVYQAELSPDTYFAIPTEHGTPQLCRSTLSGGAWTQPEQLAGLNKEDKAQNYPFMLADGITLYYGAINDSEGLGGYDIYTTRWDSDNKRFLEPENLGFPFNSPSNDYLLAIDELSQLGWLVTDRNQPQGKVCIYTFIPNDVRQNWIDTGDIDEDRLASLARLSCIRDTQTNPEKVNQALQRLSDVRTGNHKQTVEYEFTFVVNDDKVYHFAKDFKNAEARRMATQWKETDTALRAAEEQLEAMRMQYAKGKPERRAQLRTQILAMERDYEQILATRRTLEKRIRETEK